MEQTSSASVLPRRHAVLAIVFAVVIPFLTHHVLQCIYVALEEWYGHLALTAAGELLFVLLLEVLWMLIGFCKALSLFGVLAVYAMNRLRLPRSPARKRWMRWLLPALLLPYLASYWLAFAFDDPHWEDLGYLSLTILSNWVLDLLVFGLGALLVYRYAKRYRMQTELSPQGRVLPGRAVPLLRLLLRLALCSLAVRGAITLWNSVVAVLSGNAATLATFWYSILYPWLLLLVQHAMGYLLMVWVAHDTQRLAPAEQDRFGK